MTADGPEHVELAFVPYLRGELPRDERDTVETHLAVCPPCRRGLAETRALLDAIRRAPAAPALDVGRFRAEVQARRRRHRPAWTRSVPALAAAGLVAALVLLALQPAPRDGDDQLAAMQETVLGARLGLLEQYPVVERLDLLEDMEVIGALDGLAATGS